MKNGNTYGQVTVNRTAPKKGKGIADTMGKMMKATSGGGQAGIHAGAVGGGDSGKKGSGITTNAGKAAKLTTSGLAQWGGGEAFAPGNRAKSGKGSKQANKTSTYHV